MNVGQPHSCNSISTIERDIQKHDALLDTGSSGHFVKSEIASTATKSIPIAVAQPDGSCLHSNQTTTLPFHHSNITDSTFEANIIPTLANSLISIGKFCDSDCVALFTKDKAHILHGDNTIKWVQSLPKNEVVINGYRDEYDKLWHMTNYGIPHLTTHSIILAML